jgi:hypothetical protein
LEPLYVLATNPLTVDHQALPRVARDHRRDRVLDSGDGRVASQDASLLLVHPDTGHERGALGTSLLVLHLFWTSQLYQKGGQRVATRSRATVRKLIESQVKKILTN